MFSQKNSVQLQAQAVISVHSLRFNRLKNYHINDCHSLAMTKSKNDVLKLPTSLLSVYVSHMFFKSMDRAAYLKQFPAYCRKSTAALIVEQAHKWCNVITTAPQEKQTLFEQRKEPQIMH